MGKRKRRKGLGKPTEPMRRPKPAPGYVELPSVQTFYRYQLWTKQSRDLMHDKSAVLLKPIVWVRDRDNVNRIRSARSVDELLDLLPLATGLAEATWYKRMDEVGPEAVPVIVERLRTFKSIPGQEIRDATLEKLIAVLRWRGEAGGRALLEVFDALEDYGKSLACVVLGLLGVQESADKLWTFYRRVESRRSETFFVGPLWGLIDLKDARAGDALLGLIQTRRLFCELFPFLSLAGDQRAVIPLAKLATALTGDDRGDTLMALIGIGHRIGREALLAELSKAALPGEGAEVLERTVDKVLTQPAKVVEDHFVTFYRPLSRGDVERGLKGMDTPGSLLGR
ncbi:MAG: hypothetical protein ACUVX1_18390 [Chloroflexota bacterium]